MDDQQFSLSMAQTMSLLPEEEVEQTVIKSPNVVAEVINCPASAVVHLLFRLRSRFLTTIKCMISGGGGSVGSRSDNPSNGYPGTGKSVSQLKKRLYPSRVDS